MEKDKKNKLGSTTMTKGKLIIGFIGCLLLASCMGNLDDEAPIEKEPESVVTSIAKESSEDELLETIDQEGSNEAETLDDVIEVEEKASIEIDLVNNPDLVTELKSKIDYDSAKAHYSKYYTYSDGVAIQNALLALDVNCGEVDGDIGSKTIAGLIHVQDYYDSEVSGVIDDSLASHIKIDYKSLNAYENMNGKTLEVKLLGSSLAYNNHVGNEWGTSVEVNGLNLKGSRQIIKLSKGERIRLYAAASESDKVVDFGSNSESISYSSLEIGQTYIYEVGVIVTENRGRYSGNSAKWVFKIEVVVR